MTVRCTLLRNYEDLVDWIGQTAKEEAQLSGIDSTSQLKRIHKSVVETFKQKLSTASSSLKKSFADYEFTEVQSALPLMTFMQYSLKSLYDQYVLENPDDVEFQNEWDLFCEELAYNRQPHSISRTNSQIELSCIFFSKVQNKLSEAGIPFDNLALKKLFKVLSEGFSDANLLDFNIKFLFNYGLATSLVRKEFISLDTVRDLFYFQAQNLVEQLPLIHQKIKTWIESFDKELKYDANFPYEKCLEGIRVLESCCQKLSACPDTLQGMIDWYHEHHEAFLLLDDLSQKMTSAFPSNFRVVQGLELSLKNLRNKYGDDYQEALLLPLTNGEEDKVMLLTLSDYSNTTEWAKKVMLCHSVLDTYVSFTMSYLTSLITSLETQQTTAPRPYYQAMKRLSRVLDISRIKEVSLRSSPVQMSSSKVDDLVLFCEGKGSSKSKPKARSPKSKRAVKQPSLKTKSVPTLKKTTPKRLGSGASSSMPILPFFPEATFSQDAGVSKEQLLSQTFISQLQGISLSNKDLYYLKSSLRQLEESFSALVTAHQNFIEKNSQEMRLYHFLTVISKAYFTLEQALRYSVIKKDIEETGSTDGDLHHLNKKRLNRLNLQDHPASRVVKELYGANLWLSYTYVQTLKRQQSLLFRPDFPMPKMLLMIFEALQNKENEVIDPIEIERIYQETLQFLEMLFNNLIEPHPEVKTSPENLSLAFSYDLEELLSLKSHVREKIASLTSISQNTSLFQAEMTLIQLESVLKLFSSESKTIASDKFSFYVREYSFLMNAFLENMTKAAICSLKGKEKITHNLKELLQSPHFELDLSEVQFLDDHFFQLHNDSRYPFDVGKVGSRLHGLILEALVLKERPELGSGFRIEGSTLKSNLNFIKLPNKDMNAQIIFDELASILSKELSFISRHLLPKI